MFFETFGSPLISFLIKDANPELKCIKNHGGFCDRSPS